MFERIHQKLGTAGFIISIVALVAALGGGAYAASGGLSGKQKKEVEKIAKKVGGKPGPAGATGPAGAPGAKGDAGATGANGTNGADGTSVTTTAISASSTTCNHSGGVEVKSASPVQNVCNGKTGFTETLPPGKTETGVWAFGEITEGSKPQSSVGILRFPISFTIPLADSLEGVGCGTNPIPATCQVHYINQAEKEVIAATATQTPIEVTSTICTGTAAEPTAAPGNLCVYTSRIESAHSANGLIGDPGVEEGSGAATSGAYISFTNVPEEEAGYGTWAVAAEEE
jgi:hypothetical protein